MAIECYAQRLLNPFRGTMHIVKYASAEAVTLDGLHWDIYVANDVLLRGLDSGLATQISDIRYGSWSADQGLKRGPLYPSEDFRRLEEMGAVVYEHLLRVHDQIPFPLLDRYELWLLDAAHQPLALLNSAVDQDDCDLDVSIEWRAGFAAHDCFASAAFERIRETARTGLSAADYLARYLNTRSGDRPSAQWFWRGRDGSGLGLGGIGLPTTVEKRTLPSGAFPPLLISDKGHDAAHRRLLDDFHGWQAAWLLHLPDLDPDTRHSFEQRARQQALEVLKQYRLYPQIIDDGEIKAALVEAVLRRSQSPAEREDNPLSTFYIEMNPSPN